MKKAAAFFCICTLSFFMGLSSLFAQDQVNSIDSLIQKIHFYGLKKQSSVLFAHFDKTVYVNNENVWFTAYLLNYDKKTNDPSILSVLLVNDNDRSIVLEQRFLMGNGRAFGHVLIPDSIPPGDLSFIIYTNELLNGKPRDVFIQPITIKATTGPAVLTSLSLADTAKLPANGYRKVILKAASNEGKPIQGATVVYHIGDFQHPVTSGTVKTDQDGQYVFSVPASQIIAGSNIFEARVNFNKGVSDMRLVLPLAENKLNIKFYPEGGNLVHATQSTVGWEAKNADGSPLKATGLLLKDNKVIDTIETDSYGMGTFKLVPILASNYKVRLLGETKDTTYTLPNMLPKGPVISIKNAISNDTLRIRLTSKIPGKYYVMVHNYRQVFFSFPAEIGAAGKTILINLEDVPKGLSEITVLDSMQRPLAERSFFAHYDKRTPVDITTDRLTYSTRQKVHLKLRLRTPNGDAVKGVVSVACIQSNRMEIKKAKDIESYFYLEYDLGVAIERKIYG